MARKTRKVPVKLQSAALVYQGGIVNLFTQNDDGSGWVRAYQGDFRGGEMLARGMVLAGIRVRVFSCNTAGDIAHQAWTAGVEDAPFRDQMCPVAGN